jgi:hypothetical protein
LGGSIMANRRKGGADQQLVLLLACGATVEGAARQTGISKSTVLRRLNDPVLLSEMQKVRGDMWQRIAGSLTAASTEAVRTLVLLQQPTNSGTVRLGAARAVLEVGMRVREAAEFEMRLAALEAAEVDRKAQEGRDRAA